MHISALRRVPAILVILAAALALPTASAVADGDHGTTTPGGTMPGGTMPGGTTPGGTMPTMTDHPAPARMSVAVSVTKDAKMGHNLQVRTNQFRWAPWNASKPHIQGQGHAHLFVDGKKITRLYSPWYYLGTLDAGRHVVKVTLNGNDHGDYVRDEKPIMAQAVLNVS